MTASTSGSGPRSNKRIDAIEERRRQFNAYCDRMLADPPEGSTWHWRYRWPSETDTDYAARIAEYEQTEDSTNTIGHAAG